MEFELPEKYKKEKLVLCSIDDPSPILYMNIYEEGDVWVKSKGCEGCENNRKCCGDCPMSKITLQQGIERILKTQVPEVSSVEAVEN